MRFMNDSDIYQAVHRYREHPVLGPAAQTLANLAEWADANSDGWPTWPKPARAAAKLMELIERDGTAKYRFDTEREDATPIQYRLAVAPIKRFRTSFAKARELDPETLFDIVPLDYARCDSPEDYATWRRTQDGPVTLGQVAAHFPMTDRGVLAAMMLRYTRRNRNELCIGHGALEKVGEDLLDAIDLASDQDQATYLTDDDGKRIAAIVPVEQAERGEVKL